MPRLNIEDRFWADVECLVRHFSSRDEAIGHAIMWFRYAQNQYIERKVITEEMFKAMGFNEALFPIFAQRVPSTNQAEPSTIQATSQDKHFGWYFDGVSVTEKANAYKKEAGRIGGRVSAQRARNEKGQLLPKQQPSSAQAETKQPPSNAQPSSTSTSTSTSTSKELHSLVPKECPHPRKQTYAIADHGQFYRDLSEFKSGWLKLYSAEYLERELDKALLWLKANPGKAKKTTRGWQQFFSGWFDRGWSRAQAQIPTNPVAQGNGWDSKAALVRATLNSYGTGTSEQPAIVAKLGPELYQIAIKAGIHKIRQVPGDGFYIRTVAGMLKAAAEQMGASR